MSTISANHFKEMYNSPYHQKGGFRKSTFQSFQAADGFLFVVNCHTGIVVYVSDSITPVLNQPQVNISNIFPHMIYHLCICSLSVE